MATNKTVSGPQVSRPTLKEGPPAVKPKKEAVKAERNNRR